jgi:23S rRNA pseudouridine1911/1915/1917 synthase
VKRRTLVAERNERLSKVLARELALTDAEAKALVEGGAVYVDGKRVREPAQWVPPGAKLTAVLEEHGVAANEARPPPPKLEVLFEDSEVLVVNKPPFVVAQPTPGHAGDSLLDLATAYLGHEAGLVHRLDKETSGVTLFGKTSEATSAYAAAFRERGAKKRYLAVTGPGLPSRGRIDLPLSRDPSRPGRWRATKKANGLEAVTEYERLSSGETCLVALFPLTGRTHQLRAHLAGIGFPIVGDRLYGGAEGARCLLHAQGLIVLGKLFEAPLPDDLAASFQRAGVQAPRGAW